MLKVRIYLHYMCSSPEKPRRRSQGGEKHKEERKKNFGRCEYNVQH